MAASAGPQVAEDEPRTAGRGVGWVVGCMGLLAFFVIMGGIGGAFDQPASSTSDATAPSDMASSPAPTSVPELEVLSFSWIREYGYATLEGEVRNISGAPIDNVVAVASFYDAAGNFITSGDALIDYRPILPGQTSPFGAMATGQPRDENRPR